MAVVKEVELITEPKELMRWMAEHDVLMDLSQDDIQILLNYMEGHDYAVGIDATGQLLRVDLSSEEMECVEYTLDEIIDLVCEWNYELILEADTARNNPKNMIDFVNEQSRYESYKQDEVHLDRMFDQTIYRVQIDELAERLAGEFIKNMGLDVNRAAAGIAEGIKEYKTERKR